MTNISQDPHDLIRDVGHFVVPIDRGRGQALEIPDRLPKHAIFPARSFSDWTSAEMAFFLDRTSLNLEPQVFYCGFVQRADAVGAS
jgi:hypothetical protein